MGRGGGLGGRAARNHAGKGPRPQCERSEPTEGGGAGDPPWPRHSPRPPARAQPRPPWLRRAASEEGPDKLGEAPAPSLLLLSLLLVLLLPAAAAAPAAGAPLSSR